MNFMLKLFKIVSDFQNTTIYRNEKISETQKLGEKNQQNFIPKIWQKTKT